MKIVFFGTPEFAVPSLGALAASRHEVVLVVAQPDRPAGRGMKMRSPAVAVRARQSGLALVQPERIRSTEFLDSVRTYSPDLGVVVAYGRILPPTLLEIPPHGFINVHGSILPEYRGAAPIQRAIEAGETETGITIMRVDEKLDHGPVFAAARTGIGRNERTPALAARLAIIGSQSLVEVVNQIAEDRAIETPQNHDEATEAPKLAREEGRADWNLEAQTIYNRFRAFDPWPGIFAQDPSGETIRLREIELPGFCRSGQPGEILSATEDGVDVATGSGVVRLLVAQRAGKPAVSAAELFRSLGLKAGDVLA